MYLSFKTPAKKRARSFCQLSCGRSCHYAITWAELLRGLDKYEPKAEFERLRGLLQVLPFDEKSAVCFGEYMKTANHKASFDTLIACHAKAHQLTLVTNNTKDFERYGVSLENWVQA